eukprot:CCRYP_011796-RA/>CCRYP_011796-RA protein AED:0.06 eAED:0.06 QI:92/1/1/1/0.25/0.2/5/5467/374
MGRLSRDKRDVFYRRAKETGYRARSAFKLLQIDAEFDLFGRRWQVDVDVDAPSVSADHHVPASASEACIKKLQQKPNLTVCRAVDLCAAPGGWSQVLVERLRPSNGVSGIADSKHGATCHSCSATEPEENKSSPQIVAVDLWPMEPIEGVDIIRGDITSLDTARQIIDCFSGRRAELVVCDGAPDVTGLHSFDSYIQHQLLMAAVNITTHILCKGGTFVAKIFRTREVGLVYTQLRLLFEDVKCAKPTASRNASVESFVVCQGFGYGKLEINKCLNLALEGGWDEEFSGLGGLREFPGAVVVPSTVPFVSCGILEGLDSGGFVFLDADKSYPLEGDSSGDEGNVKALAPLAPPIQPPYELGMAKLKEAKASKKV